jgi:hypothetical protein
MYTAQVGPDNAARLAVTGPDGIALFEELPGGVVQIKDLDSLRARPHGDDGYLTDDEEGLQIWIDGESYPLFDDFDAAVADALGLQSEYAQAKHSYDRSLGRYGAALAKVVELSASSSAAATALGIDEAEIADVTTRANELAG